MAGEFEEIFLKVGAGNSILVEGNAESGKEFFCRLLLRQALDAGFPVAILSFHPESHIAWFREFAAKNAALVRHAEAPENLTELGIALKEQGKGCRLVYIDFFEILSAKFDTDDILDAIAFNVKKLKAGKISFLQAVNPEAVDAKQMSKLRELFDIDMEVRRKDSSMEYRYRRHPTEFGQGWHGFSLSEVVVESKTLADFCRTAMEYELRVVGHYGRNFSKFDDEGKRELFRLSQASMGHFKEVESLLQMEVEAAKLPPASKEELLKILEEGLLEERVMKERYNEYADESGDEKAKAVFSRLSSEEADHERTVERLREKLSK